MENVSCEEMAHYESVPEASTSTIHVDSEGPSTHRCARPPLASSLEL